MGGEDDIRRTAHGLMNLEGAERVGSAQRKRMTYVVLPMV